MDLLPGAPQPERGPTCVGRGGTTELPSSEVLGVQTNQQHLANSAAPPGEKGALLHAGRADSLAAGPCSCGFLLGSIKSTRHVPDTDQMDAETRQSQWSHVFSFDFF